jgi:CHAT domain
MASALKAISRDLRPNYRLFASNHLIDTCLLGTVAQMIAAIASDVRPSPLPGPRDLALALDLGDADPFPLGERSSRSFVRPTLRNFRATRPTPSGEGSFAREATVAGREPREVRRVSRPSRKGRNDDAPPRQPRYANAAIFDRRDDRKKLKTIDPDDIVRLRLDIGPLSTESQVQNARPLRLPKVLRDVDIDVVVSSTDFGVALDATVFKPGSLATIAQGRFRLPSDGGPALAADGSGYLYFFLKAPGNAYPPARVRIGYYYRNILLQSQKLTLVFDSFSIETDYTASNDFSQLEDIPERPRFSILTNDNGADQHQIIIRRPGAGAAAPVAATFALNDDALRLTIGKLRKTLTDRAPTEKALSAQALEEDLRRLAPIGWDLYSQLPGQISEDFFSDLQSAPDSFVVQVGRPATSGFVLPWSYVYEIPLFSDAELTVCPMVEHWDGKAPLFDGDLRQCPHGPHERNVLCPFGFWGFRYTIEQLSSSDKPVLTVPAAAGCDVVMGETQYDIDLRKLADHAKRLGDLFAGMPAKPTLREGKSKASLETLLGADLPFIYFYCHGEKVNIADANTYLGVGKAEKITAQDLIGWTKSWYTKLKKLIWNSVRPLVFINACHTVAIEPETLVSYLQAFVSRGRAAGLIGTEVRVDQTLAMDVGEQFVAAWLSGQKTVEEALRAIRLDYLRNGNMLGLVYTPYCWSELKIVNL